MTTPPPDFNSMSPAELRNYAKDNEIDLSPIDSRRKAELVSLLSAWHVGEEYSPPESDDQPSIPQEYKDELARAYSGTAIDDASGSETGDDSEASSQASAEGFDEAYVATPVEGRVFYEADESKDDVKYAFEAGDKGATAPPTAPAATVTLEQLELADLVGDDNRVRTVLNSFPVIVNGVDLCRLMLVEVPGEGDTLALVWWRNTPRGPEQQAPIARVVARVRDPETKRDVVTTADGDEVEYYRSTSCPTCGNRLANWRPWKPPVRMVQIAKR